MDEFAEGIGLGLCCLSLSTAWGHFVSESKFFRVEVVGGFLLDIFKFVLSGNSLTSPSSKSGNRISCNKFVIIS